MGDQTCGEHQPVSRLSDSEGWDELTVVVRCPGRCGADVKQVGPCDGLGGEVIGRVSGYGRRRSCVESCMLGGRRGRHDPGQPVGTGRWNLQGTATGGATVPQGADGRMVAFARSGAARHVGRSCCTRGPDDARLLALLLGRLR